MNNNETARRGYPYLKMCECTPMRSPFVAPGFLENRLVITGLMEQQAPASAWAESCRGNLST